MEEIILIVHLMLAMALIGLVLMQRSEGGALGIGGGGGGGGGGGMGGFLTARGSANFLTRATAMVATAFIITSLSLAILAGGQSAPRDRIGTGPAGSNPPITTTPNTGSTTTPPTNTPTPTAPDKK